MGQKQLRLEEVVENATVVSTYHNPKKGFDFKMGGVGALLFMTAAALGNAPALVYIVFTPLTGTAYGRLGREEEFYLVEFKTESGRRFDGFTTVLEYGDFKTGDRVKVHYELKKRKILPGLSAGITAAEKGGRIYTLDQTY